MAQASFIHGLGVAIATPFTASGELDYMAFRRLVGHLNGREDFSGESGGADFLVVLGSTGEAATVLDSERRKLVDLALECAGMPVIVGTGTNATARTVELTKEAASQGADGVLVVTPFYNKPTAEGLVAHFSAAAEAAGGRPVVAYNVPGRTGLNMTPAIMSRLWKIPGIAALKESSGNLAQIGEILRTMPEGRTLLSGDDALALPAIALGAHGLISVIGNILPKRAKAMIDAALAGRRAEAARLHAELLPYMDALFLESNPIPLKSALEIAGICSGELRLPLTRSCPATAARLAELFAPLFGRHV